MLKFSNKIKLLLFVISYLFSCTLILSENIFLNGSFIESFATEFQFDFSFWGLAFLVSIPVLITLILILNFVVNFRFKESKNIWNSKKVFFITLIGVFLTSFFFLLVYFPGSNMNDTLYILHNPVFYSFQYPLVYNLVISGIYHFFLLITKSMNFSFFMVGFIQMLFMTFVISYLVSWFHKEFKRNYFTILLIIYFIFLPIIHNYNSALLRDPIYAAILMLLIPSLYSIIKSKGDFFLKDTNIIKIIVLFSCLCFSRNNGIFVVVLFFFFLIILYKKMIKRIIMVIVGFLFLFYTPSIIISREQLFQEKVAIPMQQIVYTMKYSHLNSEDDEKFMNDLVREGVITDYYCPFNMDCIKWGGSFKNFEFNNLQEEFFAIWIKNLPTHFTSYVKAYLLQTYHLWSIEKIGNRQSSFLGVDLRDQKIYYYFNQLKDQNLFDDEFIYLCEGYYEKFIVFFNAGTCFWILIFICLIFIAKGQNICILLCSSSLFSWITLMIACPLTEAFRYAVYFVYLIPILLVISLSVPFRK